VINCGFRPTVVRISAAAATSGLGSYMSAVWINGTMSGNTMLYNEGTVGLGQNTPTLHTDISDYMTFSVGSVTNTGCTITWTETGTFSASVTSNYLYEIEGDF